MKTFTFFRGIAVRSEEAERIIGNIRNHGMSGSEGHWQLSVPDPEIVRENLDTFFAMENLSRDDMSASTACRVICACGRSDDASYYATRHNASPEHDQPLVIELIAELEEICVDGRDFLYTAFQLWDSESDAFQEWQASVLRDLFGTAVDRYFAAVLRSKKQGYRIAMADLASVDPHVVQAHYENDSAILGRYGTRFCSAFFVKTPVSAERVKRVYVPAPADRPAGIALEEFLAGGYERRRK